MALYKDRAHAKLFGVCAGIAKFSGQEVTLIRVMTVFFSFMFPPTAFFYVLLAFLLNDAPQSDETTDFKQALDAVERDLKLIETHVLQLEDYVTSDAFALHRKLGEL